MNKTKLLHRSEMCVWDKKTGRMTDASIHEPILAGISEENEEKLIEATRQRARAGGMTLEQIAVLFPKK